MAFRCPLPYTQETMMAPTLLVRLYSASRLSQCISFVSLWLLEPKIAVLVLLTTDHSLILDLIGARHHMATSD